MGLDPWDRPPTARRPAGKLGKLPRKLIRTNDAHHTSRCLADWTHTIALEDLNVKGMTKSAKGMVEEPGANVGAKSELNQEILVTGWSRLPHQLADKMGAVIHVPSFGSIILDQPNICIQPLTGYCDPHLGLVSETASQGREQGCLTMMLLYPCSPAILQLLVFNVDRSLFPLGLSACVLLV